MVEKLEMQDRVAQADHHDPLASEPVRHRAGQERKDEAHKRIEG